MRAISIEQYGGPEVLQWQRDAPVPEPGPDEVLVRVAYAGVNFMDVHTRQGKYAASRTYPVRLPCTLGMEGAGRVIAVGHNVTTVKAGDSRRLVHRLGQLRGLCAHPRRPVRAAARQRCVRCGGGSDLPGKHRPLSGAGRRATASRRNVSHPCGIRQHRAAIGPVGQASGRDRLRHRQQCGKVRRRHGARRGCRLPLW